jgi:hypothetical protein
MDEKTSTMAEEEPERRASGLWLFAAATVSVFVALCGMWLGAAFTTRSMPAIDQEYESVGRVLLQPIPKAPEALATDSLIQLNKQWSAATQAELLKSQAVVGQAVERFRLNELASFKNVQAQHVAGLICRALTTSLVDTERNSEPLIVEIRYRSTNVVDAMTVIKAVVRAYQEWTEKEFRSGLDTAVRVIRDGRDSLRAEIRKKNSEIDSLTKDLSMDPDGDNHPAALLKPILKELDAIEKFRLELQALITTVDEAQLRGDPASAIDRLVNERWTSKVERAPSESPQPTSPLDTQSLVRKLHLEAALLGKEQSAWADRKTSQEKKLLLTRDLEIRCGTVRDDIKRLEDLDVQFLDRMQQLELFRDLFIPLKTISAPDGATPVVNDTPNWQRFVSPSACLGGIAGLVTGLFGMFVVRAFFLLGQP